MMEAETFDLMARRLRILGVRRAVLHGFLGAALAKPLALLEPAYTEAKKKRKHKKKKCKGGKKRCGKKCVDLSTSEGHCGSCSTRCSETQFCDGGRCTTCDICQSCRYQTVQAAIDDPQGPASIQLCPGTYNEALSIGRDLTLIGAGDGQSGTLIDAEARGSAINVARTCIVALQRLAITGYNGDRFSGGGGVSNAGKLAVNHCTFKNNLARGWGGAIRNLGELTIRNCTITGNHAYESGAGLFNDVDGTLTLEDSQLTGNTNGGVENRGVLNISRCSITDNMGGGIHSDGVALLIDTVVERNEGAEGGISSHGELSVTNVIVRGNRNKGSYGGGIRFFGKTTLADTTIADNIADNGGGGVYSQPTDPASLSNCTISGNTGGGIVHAGTGILTVSDTRIQGNQGGGVVSSGPATLSKCIVTNNHAENGGGLSNSFFGSLTLDGTTVSENVADIKGGGAFTEGALILKDSSVTGNTASGGSGSGGGIFVDSSGGTLTLIGSSSVSDNSPDNCIGTAACAP